MMLREWLGTFPQMLEDDADQMDEETRQWMIFAAGWIWGRLARQQAPCLDASVTQEATP